MNKTQTPDVQALSVIKNTPTVNITVNSSGATITVGGATNGTNGGAAANASVNANVTTGTVGAAGSSSASGGANVTVPGVDKAKEVVANAANTVKDIANQAGAIGNAISGIAGGLG